MSTSKQHLVYESMRPRLLEGVYAPGQRISVVDVARDFGVSVIPVREALRRLEAEGLLEHTPNTGMRVATRNVDNWVELLMPFAILAGYATAQAAPTLREDGGVSELYQINAEMRAALDIDDYGAFAELNWKFHQRIIDAIPYPSMHRSLTETWQRLRVMRRELYGTIPFRAMQSIGEHEALVDLLESSADPFTIELAARDHMLNTVEASRMLDIGLRGGAQVPSPAAG